MSAQTPPAPTPSAPPAGSTGQRPAQPGAGAGAARTAGAPRAARTLDIAVTDFKGVPLGDVHVQAVGPVEREGSTDADGTVRFTNLRAGTYRLRFSGEAVTTLERDVTIAATGRLAPIDVSLNPAPAPKVIEVAAPAPPPPPKPEPREASRPTGETRVLQVPDFWEVNPLGRSEPQKASLMGCTGYATTRLLQVREPMAGRVNADADETLYVVAGEATVTVGGSERQLDAGGLAVIPRGTLHTLARRGRNPVVFVSVLSGPPCDSLSLDR